MNLIVLSLFHQIGLFYFMASGAVSIYLSHIRSPVDAWELYPAWRMLAYVSHGTPLPSPSFAETDSDKIATATY